MHHIFIFWIFSSLHLTSTVICDADSDCYFIPKRLFTEKSHKVPGLIVLHCNGATKNDLDSFKIIGDSLGWAVAVCHSFKNHRDAYLNDIDICRTAEKFVRIGPVDSSKIFLFGFSGQGVQALTTLLLHPNIFRGVIGVCAHKGALAVKNDAEFLNRHLIYLVTRIKDWNRYDNYEMVETFQSWGAVCTLIVTHGEHSPGSRMEVLAGCRWFNQKLMGR